MPLIFAEFAERPVCNRVTDLIGAYFFHFLGDKAVAEIELATAQLEHVQAYLRAFAR